MPDEQHEERVYAAAKVLFSWGINSEKLGLTKLGLAERIVDAIEKADEGNA